MLVDPVTPGELLWEQFMVPMGVSRYRLAEEICVPCTRLGDVVIGKRSDVVIGKRSSSWSRENQ